MSYSIGQYIRNSSFNYLNNRNYQKVEINTPRIDNSQSYFKDYAIELINGNDNSFNYGSNYYIRIGIRRTSVNQDIIIGLRQNKEDTTNSQTLDTITIPANIGDTVNEIAIIEIAFSPNTSCSQFTIMLQRTSEDYTKGGRILDIVDSEIIVADIVNIMNNLSTGIHQLTKIGVQGPPGLLMCINGQPIRIGPSGIYEIKNNYKITSIGFVVFNNDSKYFILDYQY